MGSQLLHPILEMADIDGYPIFSCPVAQAGMKFLSQHGFEIKEFIEKPKIGPPIWIMVRKPRKEVSVLPTPPLRDSSNTQISPLIQSGNLALRLSMSSNTDNSAPGGSPIFLNQIKVGSQLGSGNYSQVFKGVWLGSTPVALKRLKDLEEFNTEETLLR